MSGETYEWLANNVLAGYTVKRRPWWASHAEAMGYATNLFPEEIPMEKVVELIASWSPIEESLYDGDMNPIETHKLIRASDTKEIISVIGMDAAVHTYRDWLSGTVIESVGDEAQVSSAGLLKKRAVAWVQIERPETAVGPDGIKFSPRVVLSTSLNATLPSQINQNSQMVVCDNTLEIGRGQGLASRIRHTKWSGGMLGSHRNIMMRIMQGESDFSKELERELSIKVDDSQFSRFLDSFIPINEDDIPAKKTRSERKRQEITELYKSGDERVQAWRGTEFGVVQAVNTWQTHMSQLRNATGYELDDTNLRAMRNYTNALTIKKGDSEDEKTVKILEAVL